MSNVFDKVRSSVGGKPFRWLLLEASTRGNLDGGGEGAEGEAEGGEQDVHDVDLQAAHGGENWPQVGRVEEGGDEGEEDHLGNDHCRQRYQEEGKELGNAGYWVKVVMLLQKRVVLVVLILLDV